MLRTRLLEGSQLYAGNSVTTNGETRICGARLRSCSKRALIIHRMLGHFSIACRPLWVRTTKRQHCDHWGAFSPRGMEHLKRRSSASLLASKAYYNGSPL